MTFYQIDCHTPLGSLAARCRPNSRSNQRGQSLVEIALLMPVLMLIVLGTVDMSRAIYAYITVISAATVGAQYGATSNTASHDVVAITTAVTQEAISLNPGPTVFVIGPTGDGVDDGTGQQFQKITVEAQYTFTMLFRWPIMPPTVRMDASSTMRVIPRP